MSGIYCAALYVLGLNGAYHESAACLLRDGNVVIAIEEERLSRRKHGKSAEPTTGGELPLRAIAQCLAAAGIDLSDVAWVAYSINPHARLGNKDIPDRVLHGGWGSAAGEQRFFDDLREVPSRLAQLGMKGQFRWIDHHLAHAASAFYPAPFSDAAILCVDGIGEVGSTLFAQGRGHRMQVLKEIRYPASIGFLWEKLARFLGFSEYDACKIMGLASYGNPQKYLDRFFQIMSLQPNGTFSMDGDTLRFRSEDFAPLEALFELPQRRGDAPLSDAHRDLAAALQAVTNRALSHMIRALSEQTDFENLCMAGGVALNCVANRVAFEASRFSQLYVQPAAHDAGTALGAALYLWHQVLDNSARQTLSHCFIGSSFNSAAMQEALDRSGLPYQRVDGIERVAAQRIAAGQIVGWFQGAMEFGPRALGNRSLLADPRDPAMKSLLNQRVKHREDFRPFAPSVLLEEAAQWFHIGKRTPASDFMLLAYPVKDELAARIPAVVHVDGTSRIQTVRKQTNPRYHALISAFYEITGVPMVLNTSFNDNEPIVCSPADAIETFKNTRIDALVMGDFLIEANGLSVFGTAIPTGGHRMA